MIKVDKKNILLLNILVSQKLKLNNLLLNLLFWRNLDKQNKPIPHSITNEKITKNKVMDKFLVIDVKNAGKRTPTNETLKNKL